MSIYISKITFLAEWIKCDSTAQKCKIHWEYSNLFFFFSEDMVYIISIPHSCLLKDFIEIHLADLLSSFIALPPLVT